MPNRIPLCTIGSTPVVISSIFISCTIVNNKKTLALILSLLPKILYACLEHFFFARDMSTCTRIICGVSGLLHDTNSWH